MNKAIKFIVLFLSLAIVTGLFVFLLKIDLSGNNKLQSSGENISQLNSNDATKKGNPADAGGHEGFDAAENKNETAADKENKASSMEQLAKQISETVKFSSENNEVTISYTQPQIPDDLHFSFKAEIFDENGKAIDRYISDEGWLSDIACYKPAAKSETIKMQPSNMNNKCALIAVKVGDKDFSKSITTYQLTVNYDGSQVWNTATWNAR